MRDDAITTRIALADTPSDLRAAVADAPDLAVAADRWEQTRRAVRAGLAADLPDADLFVLRVLDDEDLTDAERERLETARPTLDAALARHPGLAAAADRVDADREAFDAAWRDATAPPVRTHATAPPRAADRGAERAPVASSPRKSRWVWRSAALAGVAAFAVVAAVVFQRNAGFETITAMTAQTVTLADGSTADLAAGAILMVPERGGSRDARQARLRAGDALFHIDHDPAHPFTVETPNAAVTVLGTVFAVQVDDAEAATVTTDVTLVSGRVNLAVRGGDAVALAPGQTSRVIAVNAPTAPAPADFGAALGWLGDVEVRGEEASAVAARIADRFGLTVTVDPALAREPVSGTFRTADGPDVAVDLLARVLGATVVRDGRTARLTVD